MLPTLLVLDDQIQYARSLERALRRDYVVIVASTVAEAQAHVSGEVNLVLSDIRLDEGNPQDRQGLDFIKWLRGRTPTIPIIAMSAVDDPSLEQDVIAGGATKFLRKPIVVSQLRSLLEQLTQPKT